MNYYVEITILDYLNNYPKIWSQLYMQLHLALVALKNVDETCNIGFSFPEYHYNSIRNIGCIGSKIRLLSSDKSELLKMFASLDLSRLNKYLTISKILEIPKDKISSYSLYVRKQDKANIARIIRRQLKRHPELKEEELINAYKDKSKTCNLPYIDFMSLSSKHSFKLFIERKENINFSNNSNGKFTTYGLGISTAVPEF